MEKRKQLIFLEDSKGIVKTKNKNGHLYVLSNDEIKEGDWYFDGTDFIHKKSKHNNTLVDGNNQAKKVIATTDTSLYIHQKETISLPERVFYLPQPSQQFIQKYIEEYNKGNIITNVLVEYNCGDSHCSLFGCQKHLGCKNESIQTVKINPKDNTITIKKLKDSWNREEVSNLIKLFANNYQYASNDIGYNKWIEENL